MKSNCDHTCARCDYERNRAAMWEAVAAVARIHCPSCGAIWCSGAIGPCSAPHFCPCVAVPTSQPAVLPLRQEALPAPEDRR